MASGQVNRAEQAEHMAAPTNAAIREESPCQLGAVHTWPDSELRACPLSRQLLGVKRTTFTRRESYGS